MSRRSLDNEKKDLTTQEGVPDLIAALYRANTEVVQPSEGPPVTVTRDPHLRLRRTLTPSSSNRGLKKYNEAQFMITDSSGKRTKLTFSALGHCFHMDAYVWGADEDEAEQRIVTLHGISPGVSRTRWHSLGERIEGMQSISKTRFVALDWHSIDRTDERQDAFLTMLPKHMFTAPSNAEEIIDMYPDERRDEIRDFFRQVDDCCPWSTQDAAEVLRAVIEEGLGWGAQGRSFILGIKSWSGGVGCEMLAKASRQGGSFMDHIAGVIMLHPAYFPDKDEHERFLQGLPVLMCWARDDGSVPYHLSIRYLVHERVKLVTYESGGHANFDGSKGLPNFDDEIVAWLVDMQQQTIQCGKYSTAG